VDVFTILWLAWGAVFLVLEGIALFNRRSGDTLSEKVWVWSGTGTKGRAATTGVRRAGLLAFMVWLTVHFMTAGWM